MTRTNWPTKPLELAILVTAVALCIMLLWASCASAGIVGVPKFWRFEGAGVTPTYTNIITEFLFAQFTNDAGQVEDTSTWLTNAIPGTGAAQPTWVSATGTVSAHLSCDSSDTLRWRWPGQGASDSSDFDTNNFSISYWYKTDVTNASYISKRDNVLGVDQGMYIRMNYFHDTVQMFTDEGTQTGVTLTNAIDGGVWRHITLIRSNPTMLAYVNAELPPQGFKDQGIKDVTSTNKFQFGDRFGGTLLYGDIDDFKAWNWEALSAAQISSNFWNSATNHGYTAYDYAQRTGTWQDAVGIYSFEYDSPADTSPEGNHGTKGAGAAAPTWVTEGAASPDALSYYSFDGGDLIYKDNPSSVSSAVGTVSCWVNNTDDSNDGAICISSTTANNYYLMVLGNGTTALHTNEMVTIGRVTNGTTTMVLSYTNNTRSGLFNGGWHHVTATADGSSTKIFVDSVEMPTIAWGTDDGSFSDLTVVNQVSVGARRSGGTTGAYYTGSIDDVRIYTNAWTAAAVSNYYNATSNLYQ